METIRLYIDQMFKKLPKTKDVVEMKLNILDHMEEKFNELIEEGKVESEASRMVIAEFGDIDEILSELNIEKESLNENVNYVEKEEVQAFLKWRISFGAGVATGVFFCILGVGLWQIGELLQLNSKFAEFISIICMMIPVAIGVALFIIFGFMDTRYANLLKSPVIDESVKESIAKQKSDFRVSFAAMVAVGVFLCILAVCLYPLIEYLVNEELAGLCFMAVIAVGVWLFVFAGVNYEKYDEFSTKKEQVKNYVEEISGVIMMAATGLYLVLGFTMRLWHPGWIIFPLGGILCGIVSIICGREK